MSEAMAAPKVVLTVGNSMMGDDGAGPLLAELMETNPIDGMDCYQWGKCA
ncbi:hydrogenase 3 maturation protease [Proteus penneri]|nr:hydrogenase 3 maturation protease [Proteus penneri]